MKVKKPEHFSASQLSSFDRNPRYWTFNKLLGLETPKTAALDWGTNFHLAMARFLRTGELSKKFAPWISEWIEKMPMPIRPGRLDGVEENFTLNLLESCPPFIGSIDAWLIHDDKILIMDHKSMKNFRYAKTENDLKVNDQLIIYAHYILTKINKDEVVIQHNQFAKEEKKEKVKIVNTLLTRKEVNDIIECIKTKAISMMGTWSKVNEKGWEAAEENCDKCRWMYGGCPFRDICAGKQTVEEFKNGV